jgi:hypothetical protein
VIFAQIDRKKYIDKMDIYLTINILVGGGGGN